MDLTLIKLTAGAEFTSTTAYIADTVKSDLFYIAEFEPKTPISNLFINEIAAKIQL